MLDFTPKNPNFEAVVRDSFSRQTFMEFIGADLSRLSPGMCDISVPHQAGLTQQHGFFHGGVVSALADAAAGYAAFSLFPEKSTVLTVDFKVNFLNPSEGDHLVAKASVIQMDKKLCHVSGDVFAMREGKETHCLTGIFTMMCLEGRSDTPNLGRERVA